MSGDANDAELASFKRINLSKLPPLGYEGYERKLKPDEQKDFRRILKKAGFSPDPPILDKALRLLECAVNSYLFQKRDSDGRSLKKSRQALHNLWSAAKRSKPNHNKLRKSIKELPVRALEEVDDRARRLVPRIFPGAPVPVSFSAWADQATDNDLIEGILSIVCDGGAVVRGRSRGREIRGRPRFEPRTLGAINRKNADDQHSGCGPAHSHQKHKGGRPAANVNFDLVIWLACCWEIATGRPPLAGRSDKTPFGDFVHTVFDWVSDDANEQAASYTLRQWNEDQQRSGQAKHQ